MTRPDPPRAERYLALFEAHHAAVLGYLVRRTAGPDDAADAFADVFLVLWRRLDDVPAGDEARLWLFGVARRVLANERRGQRRRSRLVDRLAATLPAEAFAAPPSEPADVASSRAWPPTADRPSRARATMSRGRRGRLQGRTRTTTLETPP